VAGPPGRLRCFPAADRRQDAPAHGATTQVLTPVGCVVPDGSSEVYLSGDLTEGFPYGALRFVIIALPLLGPGWRKPGWNPQIRGVPAHASKRSKRKFRGNGRYGSHTESREPDETSSSIFAAYRPGIPCQFCPCDDPAAHCTDFVRGACASGGHRNTTRGSQQRTYRCELARQERTRIRQTDRQSRRHTPLFRQL